MTDASLIEASDRILECIYNEPEMGAYHYEKVREFEKALERAKARSGRCKDCRWWDRIALTSWGGCEDTLGESDLMVCSSKFGCIYWRPREEKAE